MRAVHTGEYVVFDGNGRLALFRRPFLTKCKITGSRSLPNRFKISESYFLRQVREIRGVLPPDDAGLDLTLTGAHGTPLIQGVL